MELTLRTKREGLARGVRVDHTEKPIVIVIGMHRSGTSLCSHVLSAMGLDMATVAHPEPSNEKGHWERWEIVEFHDRILAHFDRTFFGPHHDLELPAAWWADPVVRGIESEICTFLEAKLSESTELFGFKDPRTALFLPMWNRIFGRLKLRPYFVLCWRNFASVGESLLKRDKLPRELGELRALIYTTSILRYLGSAAACLVDYDDWFVDPALNVRALVSFLPFEPIVPADELVSAVLRIREPGLRHFPGSLVRFANPLVERCYEELTRVLKSGEDISTLAPLWRSVGWGHELASLLAESVRERAVAERSALVGAASSRKASDDEGAAELERARSDAAQARALADHLRHALEIAAGEAAALRNRLVEHGAAGGSWGPDTRDAVRDEHEELQRISVELADVKGELARSRAAYEAEVAALRSELNAKKIAICELRWALEQGRALAT